MASKKESSTVANIVAMVESEEWDRGDKCLQPPDDNSIL